MVEWLLSVRVEQIQDSARKSLLSYCLHALVPLKSTFHFQFYTFHFFPLIEIKDFGPPKGRTRKNINHSTVQLQCQAPTLALCLASLAINGYGFALHPLLARRPHKGRKITVQPFNQFALACVGSGFLSRRK